MTVIYVQNQDEFCGVSVVLRRLGPVCLTSKAPKMAVMKAGFPAVAERLGGSADVVLKQWIEARREEQSEERSKRNQERAERITAGFLLRLCKRPESCLRAELRVRRFHSRTNVLS